jgi:hypothetical protein
MEGFFGIKQVDLELVLISHFIIHPSSFILHPLILGFGAVLNGICISAKLH